MRRKVEAMKAAARTCGSRVAFTVVVAVARVCVSGGNVEFMSRRPKHRGEELAGGPVQAIKIVREVG